MAGHLGMDESPGFRFWYYGGSSLRYREAPGYGVIVMLDNVRCQEIRGPGTKAASNYGIQWIHDTVVPAAAVARRARRVDWCIVDFSPRYS